MKKDFFAAAAAAEGLGGASGAAAAAGGSDQASSLGSPSALGGGGQVTVKEEPDFIETHCHWIGCDREFDTQDQLVKVSLWIETTHVVRYRYRARLVIDTSHYGQESGSIVGALSYFLSTQLKTL